MNYRVQLTPAVDLCGWGRVTVKVVWQASHYPCPVKLSVLLKVRPLPSLTAWSPGSNTCYYGILVKLINLFDFLASSILGPFKVIVKSRWVNLCQVLRPLPGTGITEQSRLTNCIWCHRAKARPFSFIIGCLFKGWCLAKEGWGTKVLFQGKKNPGQNFFSKRLSISP